jgi:hypothetical protein
MAKPTIKTPVKPMYKFVCTTCGTECSTPKQGETPQNIYWTDGHSCTWTPVENPLQVELIQAKAELRELQEFIGLDPGETPPPGYLTLRERVLSLEKTVFLKNHG